MITKIIRKYLSGRFSPGTEERVQRWIISDQDAEVKEEASQAYWKEIKPVTDASTYEAWERVNERTGYNGRQPVTIPFFKKMLRIAAVFIPLFMLVGGYWYYQSGRDHLVEISVPYGEDKYLLLPDSTEIWLNAGTTIRYAGKMKGHERLVYLDGEAYFSVIRNEAKPFIVKTSQQEVKVLGTEFNVKAYPEDDRTITALIRGKVEVNTGTDGAIVLKPDERLTYHHQNSRIEIAELVPLEAGGWRTGQLFFEGASLDEIIRTLERRFDVPVINNTFIPSSKIYTIKFLKEHSLDEFLQVLQDIAGFTYRKENGSIILIN